MSPRARRALRRVFPAAVGVVAAVVGGVLGGIFAHPDNVEAWVTRAEAFNVSPEFLVIVIHAAWVAVVLFLAVALAPPLVFGVEWIYEWRTKRQKLNDLFKYVAFHRGYYAAAVEWSKGTTVPLGDPPEHPFEEFLIPIGKAPYFEATIYKLDRSLVKPLRRLIEAQERENQKAREESALRDAAKRSADQPPPTAPEPVQLSSPASSEATSGSDTGCSGRSGEPSPPEGSPTS